MEQQEVSQQFSTVEQLILRVGWLEQRRFAQDLADFGLTPPQFFVLRSILTRGKNPTMSALADDTLQHCATITGIVDRLVRMGLVTRHRAAHDRRQVLVELTSAGREVLEKVRQGREARLRSALARLSAQDAMELLRLLTVYLEVFRTQYEGAGDTQQEALVQAHGDATR